MRHSAAFHRSMAASWMAGTESAYELEWHHGNAVFADIPESTKAQAAVRGYDPDRLERGRSHLHERFRSFTPAEVRYYGPYGVLSEMNLFDINEGCGLLATLATGRWD